MSSALDAAVLTLILALPLLWVVQREMANLSDPRYLRDHGVVIVSERALQAHSEPIGEYRGHPIWARVRFMDMEYRFDRVAERSARHRLSPRELFLYPGLVYITD
jgi:hypothetical protein